MYRMHSKPAPLNPVKFIPSEREISSESRSCTCIYVHVHVRVRSWKLWFQRRRKQQQRLHPMLLPWLRKAGLERKVGLVGVAGLGGTKTTRTEKEREIEIEKGTYTIQVHVQWILSIVDTTGPKNVSRCPYFRV